MDVRCPIRVYLLDKSYTLNTFDQNESAMERFSEFQVY